MTMTTSMWRILPAATLAVALSTAIGPAEAGDYDLVKRAPGAANALILIDVDGLSKSPVAVREKWREKKTAAAAGLPELPRDARAVLMASKLDGANGVDSRWDVGLVEMKYGVVMETLAKAEGGYVDDVEGLPASSADEGKGMAAKSFTHQVNGLFTDRRERAFRDAVAKVEGLKVVSLDLGWSEVVLEFDRSKVVPDTKPEDYAARLNDRIRGASRYTLGLRPPPALPRDRLRRVEVEVAGLDCEACSLALGEIVEQVEAVALVKGSFREGKVVAWIDPSRTERSKIGEVLRRREVVFRSP